MSVDVKICGLSTPDTVTAALDAGADLVGLVFYPKSPRNVSLAKAKSLAALARKRAKIVALIVDAEDSLIDDIVSKVNPDFFQAHGNESPERVTEICSRTGKQISSGSVNPVSPKVKRHPKNLGIGSTPPADLMTRLKQREAAVRGDNAPRCSNARCAGIQYLLAIHCGDASDGENRDFHGCHHNSQWLQADGLLAG